MVEVEKTWTEHQGEMCAGINWDRFGSSQTHQVPNHDCISLFYPK